VAWVSLQALSTSLISTNLTSILSILYREPGRTLFFLPCQYSYAAEMDVDDSFVPKKKKKKKDYFIPY